MKYPISTSQRCPSVREMPPVTATTLKNSTADVLDQVIRKGPVSITRHNKPKAVLMPLELFEQLTGGEEPWLADLRKEYQVMLEEMQDPAQKEGAERAFHATPEELSRVAVEAAQRNKRFYGTPQS